MKRVYISHPLGQGMSRRVNRLNAMQWFRWAAKQGLAPHAPWLILSMVFPESAENRKIIQAIDFAAIDQCDEFWICGHRISPEMQLEIDYAKAHGKIIVDMRARIREVYEAH